MVKVSQASYAATRLFQIDVDKDNPDHLEATETQKHDNMSLIGALSWMASQTRPDLQVGVSMGQQRQKEPTIGDYPIHEFNWQGERWSTAKRAWSCTPLT